jgi:hypothetical protein
MVSTPKPVLRLLSTLSMLLLLLSSNGDALGLHRCSHHDALPSAEQADSGHGHHSAPADTDEEQHESCTCVGTCSVSTAVLASRAAAIEIAPAPTHPSAEAPAADEPRAQFGKHLLPYSTAPPTL